MSDTLDPRFAPPQAHVADVAVEGMALPSRGLRFLGALVDAVVAFGVSWAVVKLPGLQSMAKAQLEEANTSLWSLMPVSVVLGLVSLLVVQGWLLVTRGQTVGKLLFKMRIVRSDGSKPDAWRLLGLRYGIGVLASINPLISGIYVLVDALLIFRPSRKCLHDSIADTQVIKL